jgi:Tfp pilus assembly protein PilN
MPRSLVTNVVSLPREIGNLFACAKVSLFIDDTEIRLLVVKGKRIKKYASEHLENGWIKDGVIIDLPKVSAKIDELFKQTGLKNRKRVTLCLTGLNCLTKVITIPPVSQSILDEAVRRESERELPMPIDSIYLSWQVTQRSTNEIKVFLLAQNRPVIDALIETLKMARIKPYIFDLAPLALSRLADDKLSVIADIRESQADIVVVEKGVPSIIRGIPFPRLESFEAKSAILVEELQRILKFYGSKRASRHSNSELSFFITGGLTGDGALAGVLSEQLGYEVNSLDSPLVSPKDFNSENYMVNIGSAVREINHFNGTKSLVGVNLLPEIYRAKRTAPAKLTAVPLSMIAAVLFVFMVLQTLNLMSQTSNLEAQYNEASLTAVQQTQLRVAGQNAIEELQQNFDASTQLMSDLTGVQGHIVSERTTISGFMELIGQHASDIVQLQRLKYLKDSINLSGIAVNEEDVLSYVDELVILYGQDKVKLTSMGNNGEAVAFAISVSLEGG